MGKACAVPDDLYTYSDQATSANTDLQTWIRTRLQTALENYQAGAIDFGSNIPNVTQGRGPGGVTVESEVLKQLDSIMQRDKWVYEIGKAFENAGNSSNATIPRWAHNRLDPGVSPYSVAAIGTDDKTIEDNLTQIQRDEDAILAQFSASVNTKSPPDPQKVHDWWTSLTDSDRERLMKEYPALIGALDGIPAADRSACNVSLVKPTLDELDREVADLEAHPPPRGDGDTPRRAYLDWQQKLDDLKHKRDLVSRVWSRVSCSHSAPDVCPLLLKFDTQGEVHAVLAYGDPDHSKNVVTFVPGILTQANTEWFDATFNVGNKLYNGTNNGSGQSTSVIVWFGYDTPADLSAASWDRAKESAPALVNFEKGLHVTHDPGQKPHMVLFGHSYGSLVIGEASKLPGGLHVDDVIVAGSPGMDLDTADQLGVGAHHVWAARNSNDVINAANWIHTFKGSPTDEDFGAQDLQTDTDPNLSWLDAHHHYFDNDFDMNNFGYIITGQYDKVAVQTHVHPRKHAD